MKKLSFALCCLLLNLPFMIFGGNGVLQENEIRMEPVSQLESQETQQFALRYKPPHPHP